jgi:TRAP-type C4-dicarboxylate transport system permease small subunit
LKISNGVSRLGKLSYVISYWFERAAIVAILGMLVATCIDVVGAKAFHWPLPGGTEIVYLLQVVAIAAGLAFSKIDGRQINVEFLIDKLPKQVKASIDSLTSLLGLGLFILLGWESFEYSMAFRHANEVTATALIPLYPFALWLGLCCIPMCLVLLNELIAALRKAVKK